LSSYYLYDPSAPLNVDEKIFLEDDKYVIFKIYYDSANGERVPALLSVPKGDDKPFPCILFLHGYGGEKEDMMSLADLAADARYAVIAIDVQYHGERRREGIELYSTNMTRTKDGFIQTVIDARRALDYLETRQDVDPSKLALVGGSMGALIGAILGGVEPRLRACVLIVGGGNMTLMVQRSQHSALPAIREYLDANNISYSAVQEALDPVDPINFVDAISPRPLLMHNGKFDEIVPAESGQLLYERAKEPKEIYWYDTGHDVPLDIVAARTLDWLEYHLRGRVFARYQSLYYLSKYWILVALSVIAAFFLWWRRSRRRLKQRN
jgi:cephalosporin-C deacetylase-like acetyl esterase